MKRFFIFIMLTLLAVNRLIGCASTSSSNTSITPIDRDAPSYQDIQEYVRSITYTKDHPNGPEVGQDGVQNQDIIENMAAYVEVISGTKVLGWRGWYNGYTRIKPTERFPQGRCNVSILMKEPYVSGATRTDVSLGDFPVERANELDSLQIGQSVVFSGTIVEVNSYGLVEIANSTLEPAK
jgi:hypothetical protein